MPSRQLVRFPTAGPTGVAELLAALPHALNGSGPVLALGARPGAERDPRRGTPGLPDRLDGGHDDPQDPTALTVTTSGSSGPPRTVLLHASALLASASAAHDRLGGPGRWLLALPVEHAAGVNVLVRSLVAHRRPVVMDISAGFAPDRFAQACAELTGPRRYTALVPTQLVRVLEAGGDPLAALSALDAVLVGGAAVPGSLRQRAEAAGVRLVRSYGMSETCGGCVYDGRPLDGVDVAVDEVTGRIRLAGPTLARGYLGTVDGDEDQAGEAPGAHFAELDGRRWFVTDDAGHWDRPDAAGAPRLVVTGRLDDAVTTGGVTVSAAQVEQALTELPGVREAVVLGVRDAQWGQRLVAVVVAPPGSPEPEPAALRAHVSDRLGPAAAPREIRLVESLPTRGPGKPDRTALAALFGP